MCRGQPWPRATFPIIYFLKGCKFIQESKKQELHFFYTPNGPNAKFSPQKSIGEFLATYHMENY